jgi:hypothetical protein
MMSVNVLTLVVMVILVICGTGQRFGVVILITLLRLNMGKNIRCIDRPSW